MTLLRRKPTATKASVSLALLFIATAASAASIGTVTEIDGNLLVSRANGSVKVLAMGSALQEGDILTSRKQTYATVTLTDDSSVTLGPDTDLKVQRYVFNRDTPENDGALFALANGSVRVTAGLLGTRSADTFELATPTATIDMRGASVVLEYVAPARAAVAWRDTGPRDYPQLHMVAVSYSPAADPGFVRAVSHSNPVRLAQVAPPAPRPPGGASLPPGLYVHVIDGLIHLTNSGGTQSFAAGQFGFTPSRNQPPVIVPTNPGLKFTPPPTFSTPAGPGATAGAPKPNAVDCEVR
jgi:hypothetical protein